MERQGNLPTYPALTDIKKTDEQIELTLQQGLGIMPAFPQFSDKEITALITFLRSDVAPYQLNTAGARARYSVQIPFLLIRMERLLFHRRGER